MEPADPKHYDLRVSERELMLIGTALGALPYRDVAELIGKLIRQKQEQESGDHQ